MNFFLLDSIFQFPGLNVPAELPSPMSVNNRNQPLNVAPPVVAASRLNENQKGTYELGVVVLACFVGISAQSFTVHQIGLTGTRAMKRCV